MTKIKKLTLTTQTIRTLTDDHLRTVAGGTNAFLGGPAGSIVGGSIVSGNTLINYNIYNFYKY